jgi:thiamine-phosphate pyrophosphorylase
MSLTLTAGAERALGLAAELAFTTHAAAIEPVHLLEALWLEESRASVILQSKGITLEQIRLALPVAEAAQMPTTADADLTPAQRIAMFPRSEALQLALEAAERYTALEKGARGEVGSDNLLFGLAAAIPAIAQLLDPHGQQAASAPAAAVHEPIAASVDLRVTTHSETDQFDAYRAIDAAANRAREGLRVVEDFVRFSLDDRHLTELLKQWRHDLAEVLKRIDPHRLVAARDTQVDVGTRISTRSEQVRGALVDIVLANFKRTEEAVRTLEEFGKYISSEAAGDFEQLRYRLYTIEKGVLQTLGGRRQLAGRSLYLLVTESMCHHGSGPALRGALDAGVHIVQLREKELTDRRLLERARLTREWTRKAGALFIMNDRPDIALLAEADGVHVGQDEITVRDARRILGPDRLVGVSTHNIEQARQAVLDGADYIGVGPVFPSKTKEFRQFAGLDFVRQVANEIRLPAFAIGGINLDNLDLVIAAGAERVAVSAAICSAPDSGAIAEEILERLIRVQPPG